MKKIILGALITLILACGMSTGCTMLWLVGANANNVEEHTVTTVEHEDISTELDHTGEALLPTENNTESPIVGTGPDDFLISDIASYSDSPFAVVNNNNPYFTKDEITTTSYEFYSPLDSLGRCGVTMACIGPDIMPTEDRGEIGNVKPTGWHTVKYDCVDGKYLYNRCHLIGFQLTGENANTSNLITGTRYMNVDGMLPFENMVADYVKETGNHVMYRVTPIFEGNNLVATGVLMEAKSVEDNGDGILFCVFCYNVQPGVSIDYASGESVEAVGELPTQAPTTEELTYILNTNTKKIHLTTCSSLPIENGKEHTGTRNEVIEMGYSPCGRCHP